MTLPPRLPLPPSAPEQLIAVHWDRLRDDGAETSLWAAIEAIEALHHLYVVEQPRRRDPYARDAAVVATAAQAFERIGAERATPVTRAEARRVAGLLDAIVSSFAPEERRRAGTAVHLAAIERLRTWGG